MATTQAFQFKKFTIYQDRCAMKIGTDGVLLGAWAPINQGVSSILDVGTGTGVIALMLAQRSAAEIIDAIEIDENAYEQAVDNFENSSWGDRLFCYHASFQEFIQEFDESYDLIVSNPPFYTDTYKSADAHRNRARFEDSLPFHHVVTGAAHLLSDQGRLAVIIPNKEEQAFIDMAKKVSLYPHKITRVKGIAHADTKRSLVSFGFDKVPVVTDFLILEISRHQYTKAYKTLVKEFYLNL